MNETIPVKLWWLVMWIAALSAVAAGGPRLALVFLVAAMLCALVTGLDKRGSK